MISLTAMHTMVHNMGAEVSESVFRTQFSAALERLRDNGFNTHMRVKRVGNGVSEVQYFVTFGTAVIPFGYPRQVLVPAHNCPLQEYTLNYYIDTCANEHQYPIVAESAADAIAAAQAYLQTCRTSVTQAMLVDSDDVFVWEV